MNALFTIISLTLFAQIVPDSIQSTKSAIDTVLDQYNGVINTITAGILIWLGKYIRDKVKDMFKMYETVVKVTDTIVVIQEKVDSVAFRVDSIAKSQESMRLDMSKVKENTSLEVKELKEQFIEVLDEWKELKKRLNL